MSPPTPPRLARLLASACLRGEAGEVIAGDLDQEFAESIARGVPAARARRRYWRQTLASIAAVARRRKEPAVSVPRAMPWSGLTLDVRGVLRTLRQQPGYALVAILSLAMGIGANTAVASIARQLLLAPLAVDRPEDLRLTFWRADADAPMRIQTMGSFGTRDANGRFLRSNVTFAQFTAFRTAAGSRVAGFNILRQLTIGAAGRAPINGSGLLVSGNFFDVVRPSLAIGRGVTDADDRPDAPLAVVISDRLWNTCFDRHADVAGSTLFIGGKPATVVGVTSASWRGFSPAGFFDPPDVIVALRQQPAVAPAWSEDAPLEATSTYWLRTVARVDASGEQVLTDRLTAALRATGVAAGMTPAAAGTVQVIALPGERGYDSLRPASLQPVRVLMGVVAVVLLIACINVAGLMLARGAARQKDLAVRRALGASRGRIFRELLVESTLLSLAGGVAGVWLAVLAAPVLAALVRSGLGASTFAFSLDGRLLALAVAVAVGAGILAGLIPAVRVSRDSGAQLKARASSGEPRVPIGRAVIAIQIAVSLPLVAGAALMLRTMVNLSRVELGFDASAIVLFAVDPTHNGAAPERTAAVFPRVLERVEAIRGVEAVTLIENPLLSGWESDTRITVGDRTATMYMNSVGPRYFAAMGVRLVAGRAIDERDLPGRQAVVVINETAVRTFFPGINPIGQRFRNGSRELEVVGVMADAKYDAMRTVPPPTMLHSYRQRPMGQMFVVVRSARPAASLRAELEQAVTSVDPSLPIRGYKTQREQIAESLGREHVFVRLLTLFGGFALLLACVGLHGVASYTVARRTGEIGVRLALGAQRGMVLWMILRQVIVLTGIGLAIGVPIAWLASPLLGSFLYGVGPRDAPTIAVAAALMVGFAVLAGLRPARRAATLDPIEALRAE